MDSLCLIGGGSGGGRLFFLGVGKTEFLRGDNFCG